MMKLKDIPNNDIDYNNIENIEMLEDGTSSLFLKKGRRAIIEINNFNNKFEAGIYRLAFGGPESQERQRKSVFAELGKHTAYNDCLQEAMGWVDENPGYFELEEFVEPGKK